MWRIYDKEGKQEDGVSARGAAQVSPCAGITVCPGEEESKVWTAQEESVGESPGLVND